MPNETCIMRILPGQSTERRREVVKCPKKFSLKISETKINRSAALTDFICRERSNWLHTVQQICYTVCIQLKALFPVAAVVRQKQTASFFQFLLQLFF